MKIINLEFRDKKGRFFKGCKSPKKTIFTNEQINFLKANYFNMSAYEISKILNINRHTIIRKLREIGIKKQVELTKEEVLEKLREKYIILNKSPNVKDVGHVFANLCKRKFGSFNDAKTLLNLKINPFQKNDPKGEYIKLNLEKAYVMGVLCGDGHIHKNLMSFGLKVCDEDFALFFKRMVENCYGIRTNMRKEDSKKTNWRPVYIVTCNSAEVVRDLLKYTKYGTKEWRVPLEINNNEDKMIICMFIKGFFDSEGCVGKNNISMSSTNIFGLQDIKFLLNKVGINSLIGTNYRKNDIHRQPIHRLGIYSLKDRLMFIDKIGCSIKRKNDKFKFMLDKVR